MMIGLVALLGAKAEAHTRWINGKPRTCSICDPEAMLMEVRKDFIGLAELIVKTQKTVTVLCPGGADVQVKEELTLVGVEPSAEWSFKENNTAVVDFVVSGQIPGFCVDAGGTEILSEDVEIPQMSLTYKTYQCSDAECRNKVLVSRMTLKDCKVPPDAFPVERVGETLYDCKKPKIEHLL